MYYIAFARYDSWDEYGGDSGRLGYLTDSFDDADMCFTSWDNTDCTDESGFSVRRGGVFGPFDSLNHTELHHILRACDDLCGRTDELMDVAHYLGWGRDDTSVPLLLQADPVRPALERHGVTYRKDLA